MEKYTIDYSKWDRIIFDNDSDHDNDVNNDGPRAAAPQVTVFDAPTRVTFGGAPPPPPPQPSSTLDVQVVVKTAPATPATKRVVEVDEWGIPRSWTENGTAVVNHHHHHRRRCLDSSLPKEGTNEAAAAAAAAETGEMTMPAAVPDPPYSYFWSQDRAMIHLRIPIPPPSSTTTTSSSTTRKRKYHVHITNLLSYPDRHCATITTDSAQQRLVVKELLLPSEDDHRHHRSNKNSGTSDDGVVLLQGTLTHPIYVPEDYDNDEVDWSIQEYTSFPPADQNNNHRTETERGNNATAAATSNNHHTALSSFEKYMLITLYKATPMMGMALWWKRCLTSETTDVTIVRRGNQQQQQDAFQQAWRDAHEQFRQSMQSKEKYSL